LRFPFATQLTGYQDPIDAVRNIMEELEKNYTYDPETLSFSKREA